MVDAMMINSGKLPLPQESDAPPNIERPAPPAIIVADPRPEAVPAKCGLTESIPALALGMTKPLPRPIIVQKLKNNKA